MRDFKEQLESILPSITNKSKKTLSLKKDRVGDKSTIRKPESTNVDINQKEIILGILPLIGQVESYVKGNSYGFISSESGNISFYISGMIHGVTTDLPEKGDYILYGLTEKTSNDSKSLPYHWCFADEVIWPKYAKPRTQLEVDRLRRVWLTHQPINVLLDILNTKWYEKIVGNHSDKPILKDFILEELIIDKIKKLSTDEWRKFDIKKIIEESRYIFANNWLQHNDNYYPESLIKNFSAGQLAELTEPRYRWVSKASPKDQGKLFEWALLSVTDKDHRFLWERNLDDAFDWEVEVATNLIESSCNISEKVFEWIKRLRESEQISSDIIEIRISRYPEDKDKWFDLLSDVSKTKILASQNFSLEKLLDFLESKNNIKLYQVALFNLSLALDLESDGQSIREIGAANSLVKEILLSRNDSTDKLDKSLSVLKHKISRSLLLVGHNITNWDWPIIESRIADKVKPLIWDSLLVQFMLEPWEASQALGSSHYADDDAAKSLELFGKQITRIDGTIAKKMIKGEFKSTLELMVAIGDSIQSIKWALPATTPDKFVSIPWLSVDKVAVCPSHWIRRFDWYKDIVLVSADPEVSLSRKDLTLSIDKISSEESIQNTSIGIAIQTVLKQAEIQRVPVRLGMLPLWITENVAINKAILSSTTQPDYSKYRFKIARYPNRKEWYVYFNKNNYLFIDPPENAFIVGDECLKASHLPNSIKKEFLKGDEPKNGDLYRGNISDEPLYNVWIFLDPAAKKLSVNGDCWRVFNTIPVNYSSNFIIKRTIENSIKRPKALNDNNIKLFPGSEDQAGYWKDVLSQVIAVLKSQALGTVTILLVSSSKSQELIDLLNEYLAEINHAETKITYHSRRERLIRSANKAQRCIIDSIDNWYYWRSLGESTNVQIQPIIEALPIYEWYASCLIDKSNHDDLIEDIVDLEIDDIEFDESTIAEDEPNFYITDEKKFNQFQRITSSKIIEILPEVISNNIGNWLWHLDIADYAVNSIIIDARINLNSRRLKQQFDFFELPSFNITDEQLEHFNRVFEPLKIIRESAPSDYESLRSFLVKHWNKENDKDKKGWIHDFRDATQKPAIEAIRQRSSDVLVTLPTGEGKSVLFQVPALCRGLRTRRLTIVISPLRALMRDQVARLWDQGFHQSVDYLSADRLASEIEDVFQGILDNRIVLLYVAPERFRNRRFIDLLNRRFDNDGAFEYIVIDETHCVSQWGYDFRPDYFYAVNLICSNYRKFDHGEKSPFILLSATVTAANREHLASIIKVSDNNPIEKDYLPFIAKPDQYFHPIRHHISIKSQPVLGLINTQPKTDWPIQIRLEHILWAINQASANQKSTNQHSAVIVFVARRDHAEQLAFKIDKACSTRVDYFHAGLDTVSREEIYQRFKDGEIDVLVATKAFGMGMDIPHIHWAVHLAPPTFLEDYLQEVGRIGRGEKERELAKLVELEALLLYSDDDFQANRSHIQRSQVDILQITDLYKKILAESKEVNGVFIATMPDAGYEKYNTSAKRRFACNQVRKMLYWLECLNRVEIISMVPGLMPVKLATTRLKEIADHDSSQLGEVASLLYSLVSPNTGTLRPLACNSDNSKIKSPGLVEIIIDSLSNFVGFLFGSRKSQEPKPAFKNLLQEPVTPQVKELNHNFPENEDAIINLGYILRATSLIHVDDVLLALTELEKINAIEINRKISFYQGGNSKAKASDIELLFKGIQEASELILDRLKKKGSEYIIDFDDIISGLNLDNTSQLHFDSRSLGRTICYVLKSSGVRIREKVVADNNREISASLSLSKYRHVRQKVETTLSTSQELWKVFSSRVNQSRNELAIKSLLEVIKNFSKDNSYREVDLRRNLNLLSSMKLVSVSEPIIPLSYVLSILPKDIPLDDNDHPEIWSQLKNVNRLAELRADAFEIFLHLPDELRDHFIEGYFHQSTPEELETFLNEQLLFVEDVNDGEKSFVKQKSEHIRAEAIEKFFSIYQKKPEEPNQWRAITHPFNRNLLVNAGPGSGKTSVLIARIAHLIRNQHIRPEEILVLAFNRAVVFEIKSRINDLFRQIGYGAYVRRLKVFTFHTFAAMHYRSRSILSDDWKRERNELLQNFAHTLEVDSDFRNNVAGNFRSILVDEFQDANDDIFRIIKLISTERPDVGVMVIGDDDQDILSWNRVSHNSSEPYFKRFISDFSLNQDDQLTLSINFRSGERIVEETQSFLNDFFGDKRDGIGRLKSIKLRSASETHDSEVYNIAENRNDLTTVIDKIKNSSIFQSANKDSSLAILCRTNHEVAQVFHKLGYLYPDLIIQNNTSYPLSRLRHIGLWNDILKRYLSLNGDYPLSEDSIEKLCVEYNKLNIPEITKPRSEDINLKRLFDLCFQENSYPFLSHLIDLINTLDTDDLIRMERYKHEKLSKIVLSTIHKVKGLEFDEVMIVPSYANFPLDRHNYIRAILSSDSAFQSAAEEARLLYVAMTRAKRKLTYWIGDREQSWLTHSVHEGRSDSEKLLNGKPDEVGISWAWEKTDWNKDATATCRYIEENVQVGDKLRLGGRTGQSIFHCNSSGVEHQIGFTSKAVGSGGRSSVLTVSAVLRYPYKGTAYFRGITNPEVIRRGWGYVVMVSGVLR